MSTGREHHIDISVDTISTNIEKVREKRRIQSLVGGANIDGPKINFDEMIVELQIEKPTPEEDVFVSKMIDKLPPTRKDLESVKDNPIFVESIIKHMTKTSVFLYRGLDSKLDEYINSDEDNFVDLGDRPERQNLDGVENTEL